MVKDKKTYLDPFTEKISDYKRLNRIVNDNQKLIVAHEVEEQKLQNEVTSLRTQKKKNRNNKEVSMSKIHEMEDELINLQMHNREMTEKHNQIEYNVSSFINEMNVMLMNHEAGTPALDFSQDLELDSGGGSTFEDNHVGNVAVPRRGAQKKSQNAY